MIAEKRKLCVCVFFVGLVVCCVFFSLSGGLQAFSQLLCCIHPHTMLLSLYSIQHASIHSFSRSCMHSSNHSLPVACMCEAC